MRTKKIQTGYVYCVAIVCIVLLGNAYAQSPTFAEPNTVQITWVANHGFQIAGPGQKVMIDTLFTQGGSYPSPSESTQTKMLQNQAPFDNVDVVLITHGHGDHFNLNFTVEYLLQHPEVQLAGPPQVVASIRNHSDFSRIQATVTAAQDRTLEVFNGIEIESIAIPHHNSPQTQHFVYLMHINGMKILHVGDAAKEPDPLYENLALSDRKIDILIAPFGSDCSNWSVSGYDGGPYIIRESIKPKHVIMGHMPADWDQQRLTQEKARLQAALPNISVSILHSQPCPGTLFTKDAGTIVEYHAAPDSAIENQTTGQQFGLIRCAIFDAVPGDVIKVGPGIYNESITLNMDITLQSLDPNNPYYTGGTIIQGNSDDPVLALSNTTTACCINGLTLRAGSVGVSGTATSATIRNCRIMDNTGHGVDLYGASPILSHCLITANGGNGVDMQTYRTGTGRQATTLNCQPVIENCIIVDNGGSAIDGGEPIIIDSIIQE